MNLSEHIQDPIFTRVGQIADDLGFECYVIGGFVRDILLNRQKETKDIDIVVVGSGIEMAEAVAKSFPKGAAHLSVFKNFGTAQIKLPSMELEFVGARKESYQRNSRKPIVEDGTLTDDQERRDFTINALAIGLNAKNRGEVLDPFNGITDLKDKILRTPLDPAITYSDDPLRMMRAIRFASQLNFTIQKESLNAITEQRKRIKIISGERIQDEMNKILMSSKPSVGLRLLYETQLLHEFMPEIVALHGVEEVEGHLHKDNFYHTLEVVDNISVKTDNVWLRWAALLHDIGKPVTKRFVKPVGWTFHGHEFIGSKMVAKMFARMKMPLNEKMKYVQKIVKMSSRPIALITDEVTDSAVRRLLFEAGDDIDDLMLLCEADITTKNAKKKKRYLKNFDLVRTKLVEVEEKDRVRNWQPPIDGQEIMDTFGLTPGPEVGKIKNAIREAILEGIITNEYHEAIAFMIAEGDKLGLKPVQKK